MSTETPLPMSRRWLVGLVGATCSLVPLAACASDSAAPPPPPGEGQGVATTSLTTTTFQPLDDLVNATDRQPVPTSPPGDGATLDALGQVRALAGMIEDRDGPYVGSPGALVDALADELAAAFTACDVAPSVSSTTTGVGPAIGTIDITIGCDPTSDRVQYVITLDRSGEVAGTAAWEVIAATRQPHCTRGVSDGLCV